MSSRTLAKVVALLSALLSGTGAQAAVECPRSVQGHRLTGFVLYDGDPAQQFVLAPASRPGPNGSYVNTWPLQSSAKLVAICNYDGAPEQRVQLPAGLSTCVAQGSSWQMQASCQ